MAWELEDKYPGVLKVLLSSPRWERRLLRFPELSGVGRIVEDRVDEFYLLPVVLVACLQLHTIYLFLLLVASC